VFVTKRVGTGRKGGRLRENWRGGKALTKEKGGAAEGDQGFKYHGRGKKGAHLKEWGQRGEMFKAQDETSKRQLGRVVTDIVGPG